MSSFRPRWGNVPATSVVSTNVQRGPQPIAQDVVPHVPYHTGRAGQGGPTLGAMDSAPVGMYNKPRSALQPLMGNSAAPRSAEKSKRDEMWERKREQFMVKKGMSPEPDRAAAAAAAPPSDPFEAAVQALVGQQNQKLMEELDTVQQQTATAEAPSPSDPRTGYYEAAARSSGNATRASNPLSPPQSRLGSRLSNMHTDLDLVAMERRKKEEYRLVLEQQMSARSSSNNGRVGANPNPIAPQSPPGPMASPGTFAVLGKKHFVPPSRHQEGRIDRQAQYKRELDEQVRLKKEGQEGRNERQVVPSQKNTVAFPSSASLSKDRADAQKAERVREYKKQLDEQVALRSRINGESARRPSREGYPALGGLGGPTDALAGAGPRVSQQQLYKMELDRQIALKKEAEIENSRRKYGHMSQQGYSAALKEGDVFSKLGRHEELIYENRPFGRGLNSLHAGSAALEKQMRVKDRKQQYMEDLNEQIMQKSRLQRQKEKDHAVSGVGAYFNHADRREDRRSVPGTDFYPEPSRPTISVEREMNFSGHSAQQHLGGRPHPSPVASDRYEEDLRRQNDLARKRGYGEELKRQMREKKEREDRQKAKLRAEEERFMSNSHRVGGGGKVSAALGTNVGRGGGGGDPVREEAAAAVGQVQRSFSDQGVGGFMNQQRGTPRLEHHSSAPTTFISSPTGSDVAKPRGFARMRSGEIHAGVQNEAESLKKQMQQEKFRQTLQIQVEEQKKRKAEKKRLEKEADEREARRIQRDLAVMNERYVKEDAKSDPDANYGAVENSPKRVPSPQYGGRNSSPQAARSPHIDRYSQSPTRSVTDHETAAQESFRIEMEERQRELQKELQYQRELVHEMQQKMARAMAESAPVNKEAELPPRRQWSTPKQMPAYAPKRAGQSPEAFSLDVVKPRRSARQIKTPQVPDEAFVSRPLVRNSLDVSNLSELFAEDRGGSFSRDEPHQSFVEKSFAGNSKLVNADVRDGDPLDKTWVPMMPSPSPARSVPRTAPRNRNSIVEQSLQSSSKLVFLDENENPTDEEMLNAFTSQSAPPPAQLQPVKEESSPKASDYSLPERKSPSEKFAMVANFLEVEPMVSPTANNRSAATTGSLPPQTPPRAALDGSFKENLVPEEEAPVIETPIIETAGLNESNFRVSEPTQEEWQEMLNASQGSVPPQEMLNASKGSVPSTVLDTTNVSIEEEALI